MKSPNSSAPSIYKDITTPSLYLQSTPPTKMTGTILTKILPRPSGTIARVTISRPQKLNSLNGPLLSQIPQTFHDLETQNPDLRAVILTGEGEKAFIGGADITEMAGVRDPSESREFISSVRRACRSVRRFPAPVIARLNGYTLGAGLEIAAACDLRIASSNAVFGMPEVSTKSSLLLVWSWVGLYCIG